VPGAATIAVGLTPPMAWPSVRTAAAGRGATAPGYTAAIGNGSVLPDGIAPAAAVAKPVT